jgi:hypothetical protein
LAISEQLSSTPAVAGVSTPLKVGIVVSVTVSLSSSGSQTSPSASLSLFAWLVLGMS